MPRIHCMSTAVAQEQEASWKVRYLDQLKQHIVVDEGLRWGRLICTWYEKASEGRMLTHHYAACVDTKEWGLYLDCRPSLIFAKCLVQCLARPFYGAAKTIYHISMIPIFYEIADVFRGLRSRSECLTNSVRSLADIIRTPLYTAVLTVVSIAVLILGFADPEALYLGRTIIGNIEKNADWGQVKTNWTLAPCFQPYPLTILENYNHKKCEADSLYMSNDPLEIQLSDFARRRILRMRRDDLCQYFAQRPKRAYISSILIPEPIE